MNGAAAHPPQGAPFAPSGDEPLNPVQVERAIRDAANDVAKGVRIVTEALRDYRAKERAFDLGFARAYNRHSGPAHSKRYAADEATMGLRAERDEAEVVWRYAAQRARSAEMQLSAYQSIGRSVNQMYGAAGG